MINKHQIFDHSLNTDILLAADSSLQILTGMTQGLISGLALSILNRVCLEQSEVSLI